MTRQRSAIHGQPQTAFSASAGNENERYQWTEDTYTRKNADPEKNNHYDWSRHSLNKEIRLDKDGKVEIVPLDKKPGEPRLADKLQARLDDLGFKAYKEGAQNAANSCVDWVISGDHERMCELAFGDQDVAYDLSRDNSGVRSQQAILDWAEDTFRFCVEKWGAENVIGAELHLDETTPHMHLLMVPVAERKTRGRQSTKYVRVGVPSMTLTKSEYEALPEDDKKLWEPMAKKTKAMVSYSGVFGDNYPERKAYMKAFHTDYYNEVGSKYGLERGDDLDLLSEEERRKRMHMTKKQLHEAEDRQEKAEERERQAKEKAKEAEDRQEKAELKAKEANEETEKAKTDLKALKDQAAGLQKDITEKSSALESLGKQVAGKQEELNSVNEKLTASRQRRQELNMKLESMESRYTFLTTEMPKAEESYEQLISDKSAIEEDIESLTVRQNQLRAAASSLGRQSRDLKAEVEKLKAEKQKYETLMKTNSELSKQNEQLKGQNTDLSTQISDKQAQILALEGEKNAKSLSAAWSIVRRGVGEAWDKAVDAVIKHGTNVQRFRDDKEAIQLVGNIVYMGEDKDQCSAIAGQLVIDAMRKRPPRGSKFMIETETSWYHHTAAQMQQLAQGISMSKGRSM